MCKKNLSGTYLELAVQSAQILSVSNYTTNFKLSKYFSPEVEMYATKIITNDAIIAEGMDRLGLVDSSPVVAMMSKPINA